MNVTVVSFNFTNTPIDLLERLSCNKDDITAYLSTTIGTMFFKEFVIVSTCNRTEFIFISPDSEKAISVLYNQIKEKTNIAESILYRHGHIYKEMDGIWHLFKVVCGLKSMVLGENEILTQIKQNYGTCMEFGATGPYLNKFFQLLIATGKEVRSVTQISKGAHSISSIAIEAIKGIDPQFCEKPMLLIGAGVMIQRALAKLNAIGHQQICIANRTRSKAEALADIYDNVSVIPYASIKQNIHKFHTIYVGIYSQTKFFSSVDFIHNPTTKILVDVGLPRTIDASCEDVEHLNVITVDALESVANQTIQQRTAVIPHVESCIRVAISELNDWLSYRDESIEWIHFRDYSTLDRVGHA
ncbi:MAG: glutamyl-tRNA reductase [Candidatus Marinamargulisbacteria bacterium]